MERIALACQRFRYVVVAGWLAVVVALSALSGAVGGEVSDDYDLPGSESHRAAELLTEAGFDFRTGTQGQLVFRVPESGADEQFRSRVDALAAEGLFRVVLIHHPPLVGQAAPVRGLRDAPQLEGILDRHGAEIVLDGARFWASRVEWQQETGRYEIHHVIGPDEYHEDVNNNVFTNRMARWHLEAAQQVWGWLSAQHPDRARALAGALTLDAAAFERWQHVIDHLYIPFDSARQIHIQYDDFFDLEPVDVLAFEPRVASLQTVFGFEAVQHLRIIKQADVVMMMALLGEQVGSPAVLGNNWDTYYPVCDHGSSLSPAVHAWVAARLGLIDLAHGFFEHAASIDLRDNKGNARDGIHGASCGGLWQAMAFGLAGLHLTADGFALDPHLPPGWERLRFSVRYHGERYTMTIEGGESRIERT